MTWLRHEAFAALDSGAKVKTPANSTGAKFGEGESAPGLSALEEKRESNGFNTNFDGDE